MQMILKGSGKHFKVLTDHQNLIAFMISKELSERQSWWSKVFSRFDFKIVYRPGKEEGKSDALIRRKANRPQQRDEPLKQKARIHLLKEKYLDARIQEMETMELEDNNGKESNNESIKDKEIQKIREAGHKQRRT